MFQIASSLRPSTIIKESYVGLDLTTKVLGILALILPLKAIGSFLWKCTVKRFKWGDDSEDLEEGHLSDKDRIKMLEDEKQDTDIIGAWWS
ncbi:hypothetical protein N7466_010445 [Penicillium verhagenii]|uniref:uncharacterized protein n=1 Tax=Penicillium verhagenii TaxID=1562060 RepID=UPI0025452F46|nr:uncharacterized protein N7466_010445 [Penicillium verhagenii]KAJ5918453.1 hypothetical protein N7466_010445 [Penicillium verhagenii]